MLVLFDIDHTVSDARWRDAMIDVESWDAYHRAAAQDPPIEPVVRLIRSLVSCGHAAVGVTVRPERYRTLTARWMIAHDCPLTDILMRSDEDFRPAPEIKLELVRKRFGDDFSSSVDFFFEDRGDVVSAFLAAGVTCAHVRQGTGRDR